jgi:DNA-binding GntR family transcriptional regulator
MSTSDQALSRPAPRYAELARALARAIETGRYPVGSKMPTEEQLRVQFAVSRHTVRQALRELKDQGLISAHAGIGTRVRAKPVGPRFAHGISSMNDLLQFVEATRMKLLAQRDVVADEPWAACLRCSVGQHWTEISMLRYAPPAAEPLAHVSVYVRPEYADVVGRIDGSSEPIYSLIERSHGLHVVEISQEITAVDLEPDVAALLGTPPGAPALRIVRHHRDERDVVVQASIGLYPTDRYSHTTTFRLQRGGDE